MNRLHHMWHHTKSAEATEVFIWSLISWTSEWSVWAKIRATQTGERRHLADRGRGAAAACVRSFQLHYASYVGTVSVNSRKWTICSRRQSRPQSWGEAEGVRQTHPAHRSEGSKLDRMNPKIWPHYYVMTVNKHLFLAFVKEPSLPIRWKACWKEQCPWMELSFLQSHKQEITHIPIFNSVIQGRKHWLKRNRQKQKLILSLS